MTDRPAYISGNFDYSIASRIAYQLQHPESRAEHMTLFAVMRLTREGAIGWQDVYSEERRRQGRARVGHYVRVVK